MQYSGFSNLPCEIYKHILSFIDSPLINDLLNSKNDIYIHLGIYEKIKEDNPLIRKIANPTLEICHLALMNYPNAAKYISQRNLILLFPNISPTFINYIHPENQTELIVLSAIRRDVKLVKQLESSKITKKVNNEIIKYMCDNSLCEIEEYPIQLENGETVIYKDFHFKVYKNGSSSNIHEYLNYRNLDRQLNQYSFTYYREIYNDRNDKTMNFNTKIKNKKRYFDNKRKMIKMNSK